MVPQAGPSNAKKGSQGSQKRKLETMSKTRLKDFGVEYAKSGRAACAGCGDKIVKNAVRVIFTSFETDVGKRYGGQNFSHHPECFYEIRERYNFFLCGSNLPGFRELSEKDQDMIKDIIQPGEASGSQAKKRKKESKPEKEKETNNELESLIEEQTLEFVKVRKEISSLSKGDLNRLLSMNGSGIVIDVQLTLDRCADFLTFGVQSVSKEI